MYRPYQPGHAGAEAGPSRPLLDPTRLEQPCDSQPKLKKRRRLQFTSQIRNSIQRYNPDGTESVEYLHQQSTQRLKRKWDSIFDRFKDAHLQDQDEIYLGNRANGEPIVVVKDRGSLRSLRQDMEFGVFIKDEELQGWKDRPEAREMQEDEDEYEEDFNPLHLPLHQRQLAAASSSEDEDEEEDPAATDPDLREFLQAEARRKAMLGEGREAEDDEQDEVVDFSNPNWARQETTRSVFIPSTSTVASTARSSNRPSVPSQSSRPQPYLAVSSSEDEDDTDVVTIHSDSDEELIESIRTKRQNIEELVQCTTPFETLPYNDIFGLADLLKISDNSSRLYVDLVSDDEDPVIPVVSQTKVEQLASEAIGNEDVIDLTSSLPGTVIDLTSSLPNSSIVVDVISSTVSSPAPSRASSLEPAAPGSVRSMTPDEDSSIIALIQPASQSPKRAKLPPSSTPSLQSTQPSHPQPDLALAVGSSPPRMAASLLSSAPPVVDPWLAIGVEEVASSSLPTRAQTVPSPSLPQAVTAAETTATVAAPIAPAVAAAPAEAASPLAPVAPALDTPTLNTPTSPATVVAACSPEPATPPPPAAATSATPATPATTAHLGDESQPPRPASSRATSQKSRSSCSNEGSASPSTRVPASISTPSLSTRLGRETSASSQRHSHKDQHRRNSHSKRHSLGEDLARSTHRTKRPKCGGPEKCTKTFCLHCASLTR